MHQETDRLLKNPDLVSPEGQWSDQSSNSEDDDKPITSLVKPKPIPPKVEALEPLILDKEPVIDVDKI